MEKKTQHLSFRVSPEKKELFNEIAEKMNLPPGNLASSIIYQYMKAYEEHGDKLVWPVRFDYREDLPVYEEMKIQKNADRNSA